MKSVQIQLTSKCNQRCYMCRQYTWGHNHLSVEDIEAYFIKYNDCTFSLTGGEPLSYNNIKKLNEIIAKHNIKYQIFTNLFFNLNEEQKIFLLNAECVQISFDGSNDEVYKIIRRPVENINYNTFIENIKWLKENNKLVKLNCTLSLKNYQDFINIYNKAKELNVMIRFFPVHTDENALLDNEMFKSLENDINLIKNDSFFVNTNLNTFELKPREPFIGKCYVKNEHLVVMDDGKEYCCCRATNDNGKNWKGKYSNDNLNDLEKPEVLYDFCANCDRYRKFNENWNNYKENKHLYL